jgi:flagellar assembly protein FliH
MTSSNPPPGRPKADDAKGHEGAPAWPTGQERSDRGAFKTKNIPSPNEAARAGNYARFIPREELNSFAAWNPGDLAGGPPPSAHMARAAEEAPKVDVAAQLKAQLHAARQAGYQDGYRDGLVALDGFKQSFALQTSAQIGVLLQSLGAGIEGVHQDMARTLVDSATNLARQIVRAELSTRPELVAAVAHEALDTLLLSAQHITLRVHPDDHALVAQGTAEVLAARGARLLTDPSITRGGCQVESDIGVIDASLETRWRRAAASLGRDDAWDPLAPPADPDQDTAA